MKKSTAWMEGRGVVKISSKVAVKQQGCYFSWRILDVRVIFAEVVIDRDASGSFESRW